jgi:hypothetical protein
MIVDALVLCLVASLALLPQDEAARVAPSYGDEVAYVGHSIAQPRHEAESTTSAMTISLFAQRKPPDPSLRGADTGPRLRPVPIDRLLPITFQLDTHVLSLEPIADTDRVPSVLDQIEAHRPLGAPKTPSTQWIDTIWSGYTLVTGKDCRCDCKRVGSILGQEEAHRPLGIPLPTPSVSWRIDTLCPGYMLSADKDRDHVSARDWTSNRACLRMDISRRPRTLPRLPAPTSRKFVLRALPEPIPPPSRTRSRARGPRRPAWRGPHTHETAMTK